MNFRGILFFPVTPFDSADRVETDLLTQHVAAGVDAGAGGVFPACGRTRRATRHGSQVRIAAGPRVHV